MVHLLPAVIIWSDEWQRARGRWPELNGRRIHGHSCGARAAYSAQPAGPLSAATAPGGRPKNQWGTAPLYTRHHPRGEVGEWGVVAMVTPGHVTPGPLPMTRSPYNRTSRGGF